MLHVKSHFHWNFITIKNRDQSVTFAAAAFVGGWSCQKIYGNQIVTIIKQLNRKLCQWPYKSIFSSHMRYFFVTFELASFIDR